MKRKFEVIDHTADVGIAAYGAELKEAYANAACGLFSLMVDLDSVRDVDHIDVEVSAENREDLLVAWLNELIYLHEVKGMLFSRFEIDKLVGTKLKAACYGEKIDPERHKMKIGVKAATYHNIKVEDKDGLRVQVLFDI